jgi:hypothetical protein
MEKQTKPEVRMDYSRLSSDPACGRAKQVYELHHSGYDQCFHKS